MQLKRRAIMVGATFFLAAATGHVMQNGTNLLGGPAPTGAKPATLAQLAVPDSGLSAEPQEIVPLAGSAASEILPKATLPTPVAPKTITIAPQAAAPKVIDCAPVLTLASAPAAMIDLSLSAPCNANARVVMRHAGLSVTGVTSATGQLTATLPAMATAAHIEVAFANGPTVQGDIAVPSLAGYDRVAVQWQADDAFELHAFEFGADYGDAGHVSAENPRNPGFGVQATGGFLTSLGEPGVLLPMLAQVYTFPTGQFQQQGVVRLTIEAKVSAATCGREMLGETLEAHAGQPVKVVDLTLAMPGCFATGDYVVLKNLLPDVKVAAN